MNRPLPEDVVFHGCCALTVAVLVVLQMLRRPRSGLSRWMDRRGGAR